jgi:hypothetical protein
MQRRISMWQWMGRLRNTVDKEWPGSSGQWLRMGEDTAHTCTMACLQNYSFQMSATALNLRWDLTNLHFKPKA